MELAKLLKKQRTAILKKWLGEIFATYPADTARFLKGEHDRFANPVGYTIASNAERLLNGLINKSDAASQAACLEPIMRIRAVQDFTPDQAVHFINRLKTVIAAQLGSETRNHGLRDEWGEFETRIDSLTQCAYGLHTKMKEKIAVIRAREIDNSERFAKLFTGSRTG